MKDSKKSCRICAQSEKSGKLEPIFGGNGERANEIFILSGVTIIEGPNTPALICKNCIISLSNAIQFRELCRNSERNFRSKTFEYEDTIFRENLAYLCGGLVKQEEIVVIIKNEPTDDLDDAGNDFADDFAAEDYDCGSTEAKEEKVKEKENKTVKVTANTSTKRIRPKSHTSFTCEVCQIKVLSKRSLKRHMLDIHGVKNFCLNDTGCQYCMKLFENVFSVRMHIKATHEKEGMEYQCDMCGRSLNAKYKIRKHMGANHKGTNFKRVLRKLIRVNGKVFKCQICKVAYKDKKNLKTHILSQHGVRDFPLEIDGCHYCMKMFDSRMSLKNHIKTTHEIPGLVYRCDICGMSTKNKQKNLLKHISSQHLVKKRGTHVICPTCGKVFKSASDLRLHEYRHKILTPEDYYYCDCCGNKFKEYNTMKSHIKNRHIKRIRFACKICDKSYATNFHLKKHTNFVHYNITNYRCEHCGKGFIDKNKLDAHVRIHTGEKPFQCNICDAKYAHQTDYRRHMERHTGKVRTFACPTCPKIFKNGLHLKWHRPQCYNIKNRRS